MTAQGPCESWVKRVSAWEDGEAGLLDRILVPLHLRECERCSRWLEQVRADERAFRKAFLEAADDDEDLTDAVMARVAQQAKTRERREAAKSRGSRISFRLVELLIVVGIIAVLAAILFPTFARSREKARQASCMSNVKQLALGTLSFAGDYDGRLPSAATWRDDIMPYVRNEQLFECPSDEIDSVSYALSPFVAGRNLDQIEAPDETVMIYEVGEDGRLVFPHNGGANYGFVDGHAKWLPKDRAPEELTSTGFAPPTRSYGIAEQLKLAYQASVEVVVDNLYGAVLQAEAAVHEYGGFILDSTLQARAGRATLTLKVPTAEVGNVVNALGALGFVAHRQISGEDLTRRYVAAQRSIGRTRERSERLETMVEEMEDDEPRVEAEQNLGEVEREAAGLRDETWNIDARTTLATVSATLIDEEPDTQPTSILDSFRAALDSLLTVLVAVARVGAWVLVFAPIWGAVFGLAWLALKRAVRGDEQ